MKKRAGFVSNSSSCSFQIYGVGTEASSVWKNLLPETRTDVELAWLEAHPDETLPRPEDMESMDLIEDFMWPYLRKVGISYNFGQDSDYVYFGLDPWDGLGENETKSQFSAKIEDIISRMFGPNWHCGFHSEEWYDG